MRHVLLVLALLPLSAFAENPGCPATYPDGKMLRVPEHYGDVGGLKYPSGRWLYVPKYFGDHGRMNYPNGAMLRVGADYADADGLKYPTGAWLYVPKYFADFTAMKYPSGKLMRVGNNFADKGHLRDENGRTVQNSAYHHYQVDDKTTLDIWAFPTDEEFILEIREPTYRVQFLFGSARGAIRCRIYNQTP